MSGIAAIFAMMQKPYNQHMNNRMEHHPANQLTHILVHQPDDIRARSASAAAAAAPPLSARSSWYRFWIAPPGSTASAGAPLLTLLTQPRYRIEMRIGKLPRTARVKDLQSAILIRDEWLIERNHLNAELAAEKIKLNQPEFEIIKKETIIYFD
jgi:hypothetical protein